MKKLLAIFAFLIFFFSHFGKVINFCLCTITVYEKTRTVQCDCEKQLVSATEAEAAKHNHTNTGALPQFDELYHLDNHPGFACAHFSPVIVQAGTHSERLYTGYDKGIFQPPGIM